jgi:hypothetical protein
VDLPYLLLGIQIGGGKDMIWVAFGFGVIIGAAIGIFVVGLMQMGRDDHERIQ